MYRVSPEIPHVHKVLERIAFLHSVGLTDKGRTLADALQKSTRRLRMMYLGAFCVSGHEESIYDMSLRLASWYTGREVIGCGLDTLVTVSRGRVVKFAPNPIYGNAEGVADKLARRYEVVGHYLGDVALPTEFHTGVVDGRTRPTTVVMVQPDLRDMPEVRTNDPDYAEQLGELRDKALELYDQEGIVVDLRDGSGNLRYDVASGELRLVDAVTAHLDEHLSPRLLSPGVATDIERDLSHIIRVVPRTDAFPK